ncbi:MAG: HAD-IA family hydrolase [SAR324 cluster bacterium]|nr:HAD-IA family hydrolase [SAR324 cluster bacterium]
MANSYRMILFDFFNTLVLQDSSRQPTLEIEGRHVISTAGLLQQRLAARYPNIDAMQVQRAMEAARRIIAKQRGSELKELPALRRFKEIATILGCDLEKEETPRELLETHMAAVTGSFHFPEAHRDLLERLHGAYRLGIFSNFDHAPALLDVLRENGIAHYFEPVVISESIGFRKPGRSAFRHALAQAGLPVREILFVGDSLKDDVRGALQVDLDVAWINGNGEQTPEDGRPTYELPNLVALRQLLDLA